MNASIASLLNHVQHISGQTYTTPETISIASNTTANKPNIIALDAIRQVMQTMSSSMDSLINQQLQIRTTNGSLPTLLSNGTVIAAKVLSNTLLSPSAQLNLTPAATGKTNTTNTTSNLTTTPQYQVLVSTPQQNYKLISAAPLIIGSTLQLKPTENGLAIVINANTDNLKKEAIQQGLISKNNTPNKTTQGSAQTTLNATNNTTANTNTINSQSALNITENTHQNTQIINQGIRQALPLQQPLNSLIGALQKTVLSEQQLPKPLLDNIRTLFRQFQTANTLQQPAQLKNTLQNSGLFFEAKLANQLTSALASEKGSATAINSDTKALTQKIYQLIQQQPAFNKTTSETADSESALLYTAKPLPPITNHQAPPANIEKNLDVVLRQLSQQLLSTIARTQLNQLETLASRTPSAENPTPANSWSLEIPIINGSHIDNLKLHIQEEKIEDEEANSEQKNSKQWHVMLDFDLHHLGKMSVELNVKQKMASAIIWSQLATTHKEVNQQAVLLKKGLEKVGVKVKSVDCRLGTPPVKNTAHQQLVDVKT